MFFDDMIGYCEMLDKVYVLLLEFVFDFECCDIIIMVGEDDKKLCWLGCCGYYIGCFEKFWLDIFVIGD